MGSSSASVLLTACASLVVPHIMWQMEEHRSVVACSVSYFIEKWGRRPTQTELVTEAIDGEMTQFVLFPRAHPNFRDGVRCHLETRRHRRHQLQATLFTRHHRHQLRAMLLTRRQRRHQINQMRAMLAVHLISADLAAFDDAFRGELSTGVLFWTVLCPAVLGQHFLSERFLCFLFEFRMVCVIFV